MFNALFRSLTEAEKNAAVESIIRQASPRQDFFLMLTLSIAMAAFGILLGSTVILVGSMLIAPLLYPLLSLALGIILSDEKLMGVAMYTLVKSVVIGLFTAFVIGFLFSAYNLDIVLPFIGTFAASSSLMYAIIAAIAGFAGAFAMAKPHLNESLPGVAIAVALVPPLAAAGVGLSLFDWHVFSTSLLLFLVNVIGIIFSALIVFSLFRFGVKKTVAHEAVKEEEKAIKKEEGTPQKSS